MPLDQAESGFHVGAARNRVDGPLKVTGTAKYAAEFNVPGLTYGCVVSSAIARGRIVRIDTAAAEAVPGVIAVLTHRNRPRTAWLDRSHRDQVAPPGSPLRPLRDDRIRYSRQPVALVVAEDFGTARHAATLVQVDYAAEPPATDLRRKRNQAYVPSKERSGISPPPKPRGDASAAFARAPVKVQAEYAMPAEHHNPMELHGSTVVWEGDGRLTVYDKTQGVVNTHEYLTTVFGLRKGDVRVISPFVGGAFGSGLRPQYQLYLATMAALELKRPVRVTLTRDQMFTFGHRPEAIQTVALGAGEDGRLKAIRHEAIAATSTFEDYQEVVVNWSGLLYHADNVSLRYRLAQLDIHTPMDMRAPGATTGVFALECAMDELAYACGLDPIELRLRNYTYRDENQDKPFTSKELHACYAQGAERFGWARRNPGPRSMREGRELVGWGMASGVWEASMMQASARAVLDTEGRLEVATASADLGTGTYTILTQIGADAFGLPMDAVTARIGDSALPPSPISGGSWTAASAGSAVRAACAALRRKLFETARGLDGSPFANAHPDQVVFANGALTLAGDAGRRMAIGEILRAAGLDRLEAQETAKPDAAEMERAVGYTHQAVFAEVKVDEELGVIRVTRLLSAVAAGRILNLKTARSQVLGGMVFGLGMALEEETMTDHRLGRYMNRNVAEYHMPVNADVHEMEVLFVEEQDSANPLGVKGLGEIGVVGTAAAIANAIFHATGRRVRTLPITPDKLL